MAQGRSAIGGWLGERALSGRVARELVIQPEDAEDALDDPAERAVNDAQRVASAREKTA
jgi:hypothetical protein